MNVLFLFKPVITTLCLDIDVSNLLLEDDLLLLSVYKKFTGNLSSISTSKNIPKLRL